ncbi:MAG: hypothetical protein RQ752_10820 [Thermohalobaculum sp.]|nr:hypothetical protein [Thermohalobaculum sp.]
MLAADNRSLVFAAVAVASATLVIGGASSIAGSPLWSGGVVAFVLSAAFSVVAARGTGVIAAHPKFNDFSKYLDESYSFDSVIAEFGKQNDDCERRNNDAMKLNNRVYNFAIFVYVLGLACIAVDGLLRLVA